jgi:glycosyltransferase involved in cell wall biosynthesis
MIKVAIMGSRGIPNNYGGFEQFAEYLSLGLVENGFDVSVYNSHNHSLKEKKWKGVKIIHCYDPEYILGTLGQFVYDLNCILDSRKRNFDIILQLGYTSNSVWFNLLPKRISVITTNMDGLEWKRTKYSKQIQQFLKYAEKLAVKNSHHLIADSIGIQTYLKEKYNVKSTYIPYGADIFSTPDVNILDKYNIQPFDYDLLIARLEPENSIEIILDGIANSPANKSFLVIGNNKTKYGEYLKNKFKEIRNITFIGSIYDMSTLNNLRYYSRLYFHGHTVGGTNPSLLEAMASGALICAHSNIFNQSILNSDAYYFENSEDIKKLAATIIKNDQTNTIMIENNLDKIRTNYSWKIIIKKYISHFEAIVSNKLSVHKISN